MTNRVANPKICPSEKLPSFNTPEAMEEFMRKNAPKLKIVRVARCIACGNWHAKTEERPK